MKIDITGDRIIRIRDVFNGVLFETKEGEKLGVCIRDGGFEITIKDQSVKSDEEYYDTYSIRNGFIKQLHNGPCTDVKNPDGGTR